MSADSPRSSKSRPHIPTDSRQARQIARRRLIADFVKESGSVRIDEISRRFGISHMTVHRDTDTLVNEGIVEKTRGIISAIGPGGLEISESTETDVNTSTLGSIAAAAANLIAPGQSIFLDSSLAVRHSVAYLESKVPLTVITNSLDLMNCFRRTPDISLVGLGGRFVPWSGCFAGPQTLHEINDYKADAVLVSADAIVDGRTCYQSPDDAEIRRAMLAQSACKMLLVDHSTFEKTALHQAADVAQFDVVVVDSGLSSFHIDRMLSRRINVVIA